MKTILHYYIMELDKDEQEYLALCDKLTAMGLEKFDSVSLNHHEWYRNTIKPLDNTEIDLETKCLFDNQWNTVPTATSEKGLRLFDWAEAIYPNRNIKEGHWLEQTQKMVDIRANTYQCGYCGAQYTGKPQEFCNKCLDSEYLKAEELYLLRLLPIANGRFEPRLPLTEGEKAQLIPLYVQRQTQGTDSRNANKLREQRHRIESDYRNTLEAAKDEHDGKLWLMDHNLSIDNVIYYSHTKRFCFGWLNPVSKEVANELRDKLTEFCFDYDIKEAARAKDSI